jgi:hypothetical protein
MAMMLPVNAFTIRAAGEADVEVVGRIAELDSRRPPTGQVLVAEDGGRVVAAMSLEDGRTVADPFRATEYAVMLLRARADALVSVDRTPLLRDRLRAAIRVPRRGTVPVH